MLATLRSAAAARGTEALSVCPVAPTSATAAPQLAQNLAPGCRVAPQDEHEGSAGVPQL